MTSRLQSLLDAVVASTALPNLHPALVHFPVALLLNRTDAHPALVFVTSALAIVPLAKVKSAPSSRQRERSKALVADWLKIST